MKHSNKLSLCNFISLPCLFARHNVVKPDDVTRAETLEKQFEANVTIKNVINNFR